MFDLSVFATAEGWITLVTLIFLEIVLGIDNIVFISITTDRLPKEKQHIGRIAGLAGAFVMRSLFLTVAAWLTHMIDPLFNITIGLYNHGFSIRDIILLVGGAYLIYKGISEVLGILSLEEEKSEAETGTKRGREIGLVRAVATIMVMDIVFSIDSVITAVGLANSLFVMIFAVLLAIILMMAFIDAISNFINSHTEVKILAVVFIAVIGVLLVLDSLGITTGLELMGMPAEKVMVYFGMVFSVIIVLLQLRYRSNLAKYVASMQGESDVAEEAAEEAAGEACDAAGADAASSDTAR